jgi:predicted enzyme related to lactoylglutathione lyase
MTSTVTHFEIYAEDLAGLASFYRELFGWQIEQAPGVDYFMIKTGSEGGAPIRGGLSYRPIEGPKSWFTTCRSSPSMTNSLAWRS